MLDSQSYPFAAAPNRQKVYDSCNSLDDLKEYEPNVLARTPDELKDFKEIIEIAKAAEPEFKLLTERLERLLLNLFPTEANETGIRQWENWLDVLREATDTLEDRRARVIGRLNERLPYTWVRLHKMVAGICGWDGYSMTLDELELTLRLKPHTNSKADAIIDLLSRILPLYILWNIGLQLDTDQSGLRAGGLLCLATELNVLPIVEHDIQTQAQSFQDTSVILSNEIHIMPEKG